VEFLFNPSLAEVYSEVMCIAEVHAADVTLEGKDPTGKVSEGYISMTGHMQKSNPGIHRWTAGWLTQQHEYYDEGYDNNGYRKTGSTYQFLMGYKPYKPRKDHRQWEELKIGLILKMVEEASSTYRRIGMFTHPRHDSYTSDHFKGVPPLPDECTEFASFDLDNYERHTVTII
jgi:hypothetical protein